jgi:predicted Zn-dependent protease
VILANPALAAYSTADGNVYVAMGWLESFESADEAAALLAHEIAHVLLAHHTADLFGETQKKAMASHEIGVAAKQSLTTSKTASKTDKTALANEQILSDVTDKLAMPAWSRRQEREANLLGVDLVVRAGYAPRGNGDHAEEAPGMRNAEQGAGGRVLGQG